MSTIKKSDFWECVSPIFGQLSPQQKGAAVRVLGIKSDYLNRSQAIALATYVSERRKVFLSILPLKLIASGQWYRRLNETNLERFISWIEFWVGSEDIESHLDRWSLFYGIRSTRCPLSPEDCAAYTACAIAHAAEAEKVYERCVIEAAVETAQWLGTPRRKALRWARTVGPLMALVLAVAAKAKLFRRAPLNSPEELNHLQAEVIKRIYR